MCIIGVSFLVVAILARERGAVRVIASAYNPEMAFAIKYHKNQESRLTRLALTEI